MHDDAPVPSISTVTAAVVFGFTLNTAPAHEIIFIASRKDGTSLAMAGEVQMEQRSEIPTNVMSGGFIN